MKGSSCLDDVFIYVVHDNLNDNLSVKKADNALTVSPAITWVPKLEGRTIGKEERKERNIYALPRMKRERPGLHPATSNTEMKYAK